jgi:hypothetical protein
LLGLVFSNFVDISFDYVDHGLVHPDPFIIDCTIPLRRNNQNFNTPHKRYYVLLYNTLFTYDWSALFNETSVDAAVAQAINLAVPSGYVTKHKYPIWFSGRLRSYIKKKHYYYRRYKKYKTDCFYDIFSFYLKLV